MLKAWSSMFANTDSQMNTISQSPSKSSAIAAVPETAPEEEPASKNVSPSKGGKKKKKKQNHASPKKEDPVIAPVESIAQSPPAVVDNELAELTFGEPDMDTIKSPEDTASSSGVTKSTTKLWRSKFTLKRFVSGAIASLTVIATLTLYGPLYSIRMIPLFSRPPKTVVSNTGGWMVSPP